MSKNPGGRAAVILVLLGGLGVGSLAYYVKTTPEAARVPKEIRIEKPRKTEPKVEAEKPRHREKPATKTVHAETVRLPAFGDDIEDMDLEKRETRVPGGQDAMRFLAQKIVDGAHFDGARILNVDVRDHVAVLQYNGAVSKGMGSMEEGAFLRALQVGFGQFTDVDKISIESDGEPLQSGHTDLSKPLPVIRPGGSPEPEDSKPAEP